VLRNIWKRHNFIKEQSFTANSDFFGRKRLFSGKKSLNKNRFLSWKTARGSGYFFFYFMNQQHFYHFFSNLTYQINKNGKKWQKGIDKNTIKW